MLIFKQFFECIHCVFAEIISRKEDMPCFRILTILGLKHSTILLLLSSIHVFNNLALISDPAILIEKL